MCSWLSSNKSTFETYSSYSIRCGFCKKILVNYHLNQLCTTCVTTKYFFYDWRFSILLKVHWYLDYARLVMTAHNSFESKRGVKSKWKLIQSWKLIWLSFFFFEWNEGLLKPPIAHWKARPHWFGINFKYCILITLCEREDWICIYDSTDRIMFLKFWPKRLISMELATE